MSFKPHPHIDGLLARQSAISYKLHVVGVVYGMAYLLCVHNGEIPLNYNRVGVFFLTSCCSRDRWIWIMAERYYEGDEDEGMAQYSGYSQSESENDKSDVYDGRQSPEIPLVDRG